MKDYKKRRIQKGYDGIRGKRYIFYKQMLFIIPTIGQRRNNSQLEIAPEDTSTNESLPPDVPDEVVTETVNETPPPKRLKRDLVQKLTNKKTVLKPQQEEEDEDKMFLMSLLPLFKIMKEDIKLTARIKVLETVRQSLSTDSYLSSAPHQQPSAHSKQDLDTINLFTNLEDHVQQTLVVNPDDSSIYFDEIEQPSTPTTHSDFKSEPESPQLQIEERDPLSSTNEPTIPRKKPRSQMVVTPRLSSSAPEDVFDAIGKNVAHKLRGMMQQQRIIAEKIISDVMYHGQMETLTVDSHLSLNKSNS